MKDKSVLIICAKIPKQALNYIWLDYKYILIRDQASRRFQELQVS